MRFALSAFAKHSRAHRVSIRSLLKTLASILDSEHLKKLDIGEDSESFITSIDEVDTVLETIAKRLSDLRQILYRVTPCDEALHRHAKLRQLATANAVIYLRTYIGKLHSNAIIHRDLIQLIRPIHGAVQVSSLNASTTATRGDASTMLRSPLDETTLQTPSVPGGHTPQMSQSATDKHAAELRRRLVDIVERDQLLRARRASLAALKSPQEPAAPINSLNQSRSRAPVDQAEGPFGGPPKYLSDMIHSGSVSPTPMPRGAAPTMSRTETQRTPDLLSPKASRDTSRSPSPMQRVSPEDQEILDHIVREFQKLDRLRPSPSQDDFAVEVGDFTTPLEEDTWRLHAMITRVRCARSVVLLTIMRAHSCSRRASGSAIRRASARARTARARLRHG